MGRTRLYLAILGMAWEGVSLSAHATEADAKAPDEVVQTFLNEIGATQPDLKRIESLLAEDVTAKFSEKDPGSHGRDAVMKKIAGLYEKDRRYRIVVKTTYSLAPIVINSRDDIGYQGSKIFPPFSVTGFFVVKDGLIWEWKDYESKK